MAGEDAKAQFVKPVAHLEEEPLRAAPAHRNRKIHILGLQRREQLRDLRWHILAVAVEHHRAAPSGRLGAMAARHLRQADGDGHLGADIAPQPQNASRQAG